MKPLLQRILARLFPPSTAEPVAATLREATEQFRREQAARDRERDAAARERFLTERLAEMAQAESLRDADRSFHSMVDELVEARAMAGAGPWKVGPETLAATEALITRLKEGASPLNVREDFTNTQGAYGDIELALQNVDWRREINFTVLQFSRWGIQQIILICRLYWMKNPLVRRLVNVCAAYVFARGVEVTTNDEAANETLQEFFRDNSKVFGQCALTQAERQKDLDGNLFWCLFADRENTGKVSARLIDATEINEVICNPDDSDEPWYYLRIWTQSALDTETAQVANRTMHAWYPAMGYDPAEKRPTMRGFPVLWDTATYHRKCGYVGKWTFGCPRAYPMVDWAKEARRYLEACASVAQQLAQIALTLTTKGGQQALMSAKQQFGTTEGPSAALWDQNPPAVSGAIFGSGTGTKLEAFKTQGAGLDPEKVRQYKLMCAMTMDVPETFLADVSTGNLATATSLDRPTETAFLLKQEEWREDLVVIARYVLQTSAGASGGRLNEARGLGVRVNIVECGRKLGPRGEVVYEALKPKTDQIDIQVNFPAIREGDIPSLVDATIKAGTLGSSGGQVLGIDEKEMVKKLYDLVGIEHGDELAEAQYPEKTYITDRTEDMDLPTSIEATIHAITLGNRQGQPVGIDLKAGVTKLYELLGIPDGDKIAEEQFPSSEYDPDRTQEVLPPPASETAKAGVGQPLAPTEDDETGEPTNPAPPAPPEGQQATQESGRVKGRWTPNGR